MSCITDRGTIDFFRLDEAKNEAVLTIIDTLPWSCVNRVEHAQIAQDKINDYIDAIKGGWAQQNCPGAKITIEIVAQYAYSQYGIDFFTRMKAFLNENAICDLTWSHLPPKEGEPEEVYDDGFSDEYVFDLDKIYPRLKKNWAKKPDVDVSITAFQRQGNGEEAQLPMSRIFDSFVICFVQDCGDLYKMIAKTDLPQGVTTEQLYQKASENLLSKIKFECHETKIPGVRIITCGGNFEAEALLIPGLWKNLADQIGDDLLIAVPTKDVVLCAAAGDKKTVKKMISAAGDTFKTNRMRTPHLLFAQDVFLFERASGQISISKKWEI